MNKLSDVIKKVMSDKLITKSKLSDNMNCNKSMVTRLLSNNNMTLKTLYKVAYSLNCDCKIILIDKNSGKIYE